MEASSVVVHDPAVKPIGEVEEANWIITDTRFIGQLREIFELKQFLFEEKVSINPDQPGSIDLGPLNNLKFGSKGRLPTDDEWKLLDQKLEILSSYLDDQLRKRLRIRQLSFFFGPLPVAFLLVAAIATIAYAVYPHFLTRGSFGVGIFCTSSQW